MATVGAFASIFEPSGKLLLVHQAYSPFRWTQPGGRVESSESPHDAVVREVLEETGLKVTVEHLIGTYYAAYKDDVVFHFLCRAEQFDCVVPPAEIREVRFFGPMELPENMAFNTKVRVKDAFDGVKPHLRVFSTPETLQHSF
jgi:8-oxo-dGTP diphosphatase